jgi:hypothetical protein
VAALERVRGRVELGVKVWVDEPRLREALAPSRAEAAKTSGRAYLEARRAEQRQAADADAFCAELARDVYERVAAHAVEGTANRPQPRELTGRSERMILNAALLVESGSGTVAQEVEQLGNRLAGFGVTLELTGPWPPHNFVGDEEVRT